MGLMVARLDSQVHRKVVTSCKIVLYVLSNLQDPWTSRTTVPCRAYNVIFKYFLLKLNVTHVTAGRDKKPGKKRCISEGNLKMITS